MNYTIERDKKMNRDYIPLGRNWEIQTKGKGSTFRIAFGADRWPVTDMVLQSFLETMANDVNAQLNMMKSALQKIVDSKQSDLTKYVVEVDTIACATLAQLDNFKCENVNRN